MNLLFAQVDIDAYIDSINDKYHSTVTTEHSFRGALEILLCKLNLLEGIERKSIFTSFPVSIPKDNNLCTKRLYEETSQGVGRVWINDYQYFDNVPTSAWNLVISGYQPLDRWLKDRKNKHLTNDEIIHYQKMIMALNAQMKVVKVMTQF